MVLSRRCLTDLVSLAVVTGYDGYVMYQELRKAAGYTAPNIDTRRGACL